jgi:hypothetical protein
MMNPMPNGGPGKAFAPVVEFNFWLFISFSFKQM